jgi:predicted TIM-barrel enzyme
VPVWVGSGVTPEQVPELWAHADALIVGSSIKKGGVWSNAIDPRRCRAIVKAGRG